MLNFGRVTFSELHLKTTPPHLKGAVRSGISDSDLPKIIAVRVDCRWFAAKFPKTPHQGRQVSASTADCNTPNALGFCCNAGIPWIFDL